MLYGHKAECGFDIPKEFIIHTSYNLILPRLAPKNPFPSLLLPLQPLGPPINSSSRGRPRPCLRPNNARSFGCSLLNAPAISTPPSSLTYPHWHVFLAHLACLALQLLPCPGHWTSPWLDHSILSSSFINRPGVAGAVLQTPSSMIHSFIHSFIHWLSHLFPPIL